MQKVFQHFRLRTYCMATFLLLVLSAGTGIIVSNVLNSQHQQQVLGTIQKTTERISIIDEMRILANRRESDFLESFYEEGDAALVDHTKSRSAFLELAMKLRTAIDDKSFSDQELANHMVQITELNDSWIKEFAEPALQARSKSREKFLPASLTDLGRQIQNKLDAKLVELRTACLLRSRDAERNQSEQLMSRRAVLTAVTIAMLLFSGIMLLFLTRSIEAPISQLNQISRQVAGGRRISMPQARGFEELNELAGNLGEMVSALQERENELRESQELTSQTNDELLMIMEYAQFLQQVNEEGEVASALVKQVRRIVGTSSIGLYLRHRTRFEYELIVSIPDISDPRFPFVERLTSDKCGVCRNNQPVCVFDTQTELSATCQSGAQFRSELCIPLSAGGTVLGMLHLGSQKEIVWTSESVKLITTLANFTAPAINAMRSLDDLRERATRDPLTGLFNRRYLMEYLPIMFESARRDESPFSLMLIDVDNFKEINDREGHDAGDLTLCEVAEAARATLRASDVVCRFGGEEFIVLLPRTTIPGAATIAEKLRQAIPNRCHTQMTGAVTVSIGIAVFPAHGNRYQDVLKAADLAMYSAKARGRNCVVIYSAMAQSSEIEAQYPDMR